MTNTTKMPERVWVSAEVVLDFATDIRSECRKDRENYFPHEYLRADLVPQWIKCSDELPSQTGNYLIYDQLKRVMLGWWHGGIRNHPTLPDVVPHWTHCEFVTHWQPLPELPTEDL